MNKVIKFLPLLLLVLPAFLHAQNGVINKAYVDMLVAPYIEVQTGLADDDLAAAKTGARGLVKMLGHGKFSGDAKAEVSELSRAASAIEASNNISAAREDFQDLSKRMTALIKRVGTGSGTSLYLAKCPMAFGGQGGTWIQKDKNIANPYYGSQMYRCGGVVEQLSGEDAGSGHDGHSHDHGSSHDHGAMTKTSHDYSLAKLDAVHAGVPEYHSAMGHQKMKKVPDISPIETCEMACCAN